MRETGRRWYDPRQENFSGAPPPPAVGLGVPIWYTVIIFCDILHFPNITKIAKKAKRYILQIRFDRMWSSFCQLVCTNSEHWSASLTDFSTKVNNWMFLALCAWPAYSVLLGTFRGWDLVERDEAAALSGSKIQIWRSFISCHSRVLSYHWDRQ